MEGEGEGPQGCFKTRPSQQKASPSWEGARSRALSSLRCCGCQSTAHPAPPCQGARATSSGGPRPPATPGLWAQHFDMNNAEGQASGSPPSFAPLSPMEWKPEGCYGHCPSSGIIRSPPCWSPRAWPPGPEAGRQREALQAARAQAAGEAVSDELREGGATKWKSHKMGSKKLDLCREPGRTKVGLARMRKAIVS